MDRSDYTLVVLCGGLGTRIRSINNEVPKALIKIGRAPFLYHLLTQYHSAVSNIVVATGYKREMIRDEIGSFFKSTPVIYSEELEPLGTGGALKQALKAVETKRCLVVNGDTFSKFDFGIMERSQDFMVTSTVEGPHRFNGLSISNEKVRGFLNKGEGEVINAGTYAFFVEKLSQSLSCFPSVFSFENDVLPILVASGEIQAIPCDDFIDIGVPEDYFRAQKMHIFQ